MPRVTRRDGRTERGAVAVVVALLMVPLIGFAAIAIDVASMWSDRQRLQTGADASALAIAQDCARQNCRVPAQTASTLTAANFGSGATAAVLTPAVTPTTGQVKVLTETLDHHLFAPILGFDATRISASATAGWGAPVGGRSILPVTFSWCEFAAQTGGGLPSQTTERVIKFSKGSKTDCTGPSNLVVPGGFGWVDPSAGGCALDSSIAMTLNSSTGASMPSGCSVASFQAQLNKVVLLPVFDKYEGTGNNAKYRVYGYVAFRLTGYRFPSVRYNADECSNDSSCLKGYFTQFVELDEAFSYDSTAPNLGAIVVELTG